MPCHQVTLGSGAPAPLPSVRLRAQLRDQLRDQTQVPESVRCMPPRPLSAPLPSPLLCPPPSLERKGKRGNALPPGPPFPAPPSISALHPFRRRPHVPSHSFPITSPLFPPSRLQGRCCSWTPLAPPHCEPLLRWGLVRRLLEGVLPLPLTLSPLPFFPLPPFHSLQGRCCSWTPLAPPHCEPLLRWGLVRRLLEGGCCPSLSYRGDVSGVYAGERLPSSAGNYRTPAQESRSAAQGLSEAITILASIASFALAS